MIYADIPGLENKASALGFGCLQLGGHGWEGLSTSETSRAVDEAIENGITIFDTAPIYGLGQSEEMLGRILGTRRKNLVIATKTGLDWVNSTVFRRFTNASAQSIEKGIESSLKRLNTDYIDICQLHWPDPDTSVEETLLSMNKLKQSGKIRSIGLCNFPAGQLKEAVQYARIATLQVPYNLVDRKIEQDLVPVCRKEGIAVMAYSPLARGLLTGKYGLHTKFGPDDHRSRSEDEYFGGGRLRRNLVLVDRVKAVATTLGRTPAQIALRWTIERPGIAVTLFGARNAAQVIDNVGVMSFSLPGQTMQYLNDAA